MKYVAVLVAISVPAAIQAQSATRDNDAGPLDQVVPVADEALDTAAPAAAADDLLTLDQQLADEFERYRRLIGEGAMDEADRSAKRIVEMVIKLHGPRSLETSKALNNLAIVQHRNGQFDAAIQNFETAVEIIEEREDRLNEKLVNPLKGLGAAQLGNGRPDLASETFNRATHITHVNEGPHNIEQVEILESLAQSTLLLGETKDARKILDRIHVLNVRHFEGDALALIPSLMRRARWQHAARYYNDERATYRRAIRIVESKLGKDSPELILPLSKLGESFYFLDLSDTNPQQQGLTSSGELYFKRAAKIAEAAPNIEWRRVADAKLALADYYTFIESHNRARKIYSQVWHFLSADEERVKGRDELLGQPVTLAERELPKYVKGIEGGSSKDALLKGTIRVDYTVSPRGRVRKIRTEA
ncbi:MAG: tetratricopeptide repeat protein, partial [Gammaproteobacteria bacterium]|nr:tetratricopeptide repeat protein [Gammaproteobacteria bacterium]